MVLSNVLFTQKNEDRIWPKNTSLLHQVGGKPLRFTLHPASLTHKQWADRYQPTPHSLWGVFTLLEWISHLWSKFLTAVGYPRLSSLLQHFSKHFPGSKGGLSKSFPRPLSPLTAPTQVSLHAAIQHRSAVAPIICFVIDSAGCLKTLHCSDWCFSTSCSLEGLWQRGKLSTVNLN